MNLTTNNWNKTLIAGAIFIAAALTFLVFFLGNLPLISLPFIFAIIAIVVYGYLYFTGKLDAKIGRGTSSIATKLVSEQALKMGAVEESGDAVYSWNQPRAKAEFAIILHYKKTTFALFFLILFFGYFFLFSEFIKSFGMIFYTLWVIFWASATMGLFVLVNIVAGKSYTQTILYEILTDGIYINRQILNEKLTGLFIPYSNLAEPVFDDKNNFIILKIKNNRFLRRFISCRPENYKEVSDYIRAKLLPPPTVPQTQQSQSMAT